MFNEATEPPFSSNLNNEKREGSYHCLNCGSLLFSSKQKFDSGSGWPSFFGCEENSVETKVDNSLFMKRIEFHCSNCKSHHGHLFNDGPMPTGLRYCCNGSVLKFIPSNNEDR